MGTWHEHREPGEIVVRGGKQKTGKESLDHLALKGLCWPVNHWESLVSVFHSPAHFPV